MEEQLSAAFGGVIKELQVGARVGARVGVSFGLRLGLGSVKVWQASTPISPQRQPYNLPSYPGARHQPRVRTHSAISHLINPNLPSYQARVTSLVSERDALLSRQEAREPQQAGKKTFLSPR